jgi:hypothetical protein
MEITGDAVVTLLNFKESFPKAIGERKRAIGMVKLIQDLSQIYGVECPKMSFIADNKTASAPTSHYSPTEHRIVLTGSFKVLHIFAHAAGADEDLAIAWSRGLFKLAYPKTFAKLGLTDYKLLTYSPKYLEAP